MNLKKMLLLASMALAATALVAPAGASASGMFYHEGKEITTGKTVVFSGKIGFEVTGVGSFHCNATATTTLETNGGFLTALALETSTCAGGGALAGCVLEDDELTKAASLTPRANDIQVSQVTLWNTFEANGKCPLREIEITDDPASLATLTPNAKKAIGSVTLGGNVIDDRIQPAGSALTAHATGSLSVQAPNVGTYGIEA